MDVIKYIDKFSRYIARMAEWLALQTGKGGDSGSIPAEVITFSVFFFVKT